MDSTGRVSAAKNALVEDLINLWDRLTLDLQASDLTFTEEIFQGILGVSDAIDRLEGVIDEQQRPARQAA